LPATELAAVEIGDQAAAMRAIGPVSFAARGAHAPAILVATLPAAFATAGKLPVMRAVIDDQADEDLADAALNALDIVDVTAVHFARTASAVDAARADTVAIALDHAA
jgi:hypothetical protein